jgi:DNA mismatch repair protein MutS
MPPKAAASKAPKPLKAKTTPKRGVGGSESAPGSALEHLYFKHYDECVARFGVKTAILMEVGKFFEMYDYVSTASGAPRTNVQTLAEVCGCSVEPRPSSDPAYRRLFWGFPLVSLGKFERILVNAGYTVVVLVQVKDATGDVVERKLDHISSPGTWMECGTGALAVRREEQGVLGIYIEPYTDTSTRLRHWSIASTAFDVMTGVAVSTETDIVLIDGKPVCDAIQPFWSMYPPAEVAVYWVGEATAAPTKADVEALFAGQRPMIHILALDSKHEVTAPADRLRLAFLEEVFKHDSALHIAEVLGVTMYHFARRSLYHLLQFIKDHNPSYLTNLHAHTMWVGDDERVLLGNAALEQLAAIPSHVDRQHESLLYWLQQGQTPMGRRTIRERCLTPIADVDELDARQGRIEWLQSWPPAAAGADVAAHLRGMHDLARLYRRFQLGNGTTDDLLQLLTSYTKVAALVNLTADTVFDAQAELGDHLKSLLSHFDEGRIRCSKSQVDGGTEPAVGSVHPWRRGLFPDLDAHEDTWATLAASVLSLKARMEGCLGDADGCITWTLKEEAPFTFSTTARRAATIAAVMKKRDKVDVRVVTRGSTGTQAVIECDELGAANQAGIRIREGWRAAVHARWTAWWTEWMDAALDTGALDAVVRWVGDLDAELTFARLGREYGYCRPQYLESTEDAVAGLRVTNLRHPIIERVRTASPYIPHSIALGALSKPTADTDDATAHSASGGMLLYGVNAAGKSSLGKAVGLAVLMAQCGIPVPATAMRIIPYTGLYTRILGNDNLWAGMSSFVVEMTEFRSILRNATPRTLVIGDELCAGTETASATAIVAAGIQTLGRRGVHFLFATHLHELAEIPELSAPAAGAAAPCAFYHLSVRSDPATCRLVYDRILKPGCGSPMYGLEVCRGLDMDPEFLTSALAIRKRMFDADGAPRLSRYNAAVVVGRCAVCGSTDSLETHHIVPQAAADADGAIARGVHKNTASNLVPLCDTCHREHHSGMLEIKGWVETSTGRRLDVVHRA